MTIYIFYYFDSHVYPTFPSFAHIGKQNLLESLVLLVILNQNQMFPMKAARPVHVLFNFARYEHLIHQLDSQNNA